MTIPTRTERDLIEAIRLTQEYALLPAIPGWSWYDALVKHAPDLAASLKADWERRESNGVREANLGYATTRQLLDEVSTRIEMGNVGLDYRTVDNLIDDPAIEPDTSARAMLDVEPVPAPDLHEPTDRDAVHFAQRGEAPPWCEQAPPIEFEDEGDMHRVTWSPIRAIDWDLVTCRACYDVRPKPAARLHTTEPDIDLNEVTTGVEAGSWASRASGGWCAPANSLSLGLQFGTFVPSGAEQVAREVGIPLALAERIMAVIRWNDAMTSVEGNDDGAADRIAATGPSGYHLPRDEWKRLNLTARYALAYIAAALPRKVRR